MPTIASRNYRGISIDHNPLEGDRFPSQVNAALDKIGSGPSGRLLLDQLDARAAQGREVVIAMAPRGNSARPMLTNAQREAAQVRGGPVDEDKLATQLAQRSLLGRKGPGTSARVNYDPRRSLQLNPQGHPVAREETGDRAYLSLAHELVHAKRMMKGELTHGSKPPGLTPTRGWAEAREEQRAVGIGPFRRSDPSENSIRREQGEGIRRRY